MLNKILKAFGLLRAEVEAIRRDVAEFHALEGPPGVSGADGVAGSDGMDGPAGQAGEPGTVGERGPQGDGGGRGPIGERGNHGEPGAAGESGGRGGQGPKGDDGKRGGPGKRGPKGDTGKQGASVTGLTIRDNDLYVNIDGKKSKVGKIKTPSRPFAPGGGGGGSRVGGHEAALAEVVYTQSWNIPMTSTPEPAYLGGFYRFSNTISDFATATTHGAINNSQAAHFMIVVGEVPVDDITLTITGDTITDSSNYVPGDTVTLVIPAGTAINTMLETPEKFLGLISVIVTAGTPVNCNYGCCKYWDNWNNNFRAVGGEAIWLGDLEAEVNIELLKHSTEGWTYNPAGEPSPAPPLFSLVEAHGPNVKTYSDRYGAFKRINGLLPIAGAEHEGVLVRFSFSRGACIEFGQVTLAYKQ